MKQHSGQASVEFALVLPVFLLFSLCVVEVGSVANDQLALGQATRSAARAISLGDITDEQANHVAAIAVADEMDLIGVEISVELSSTTAQVTLNYARRINVPIIGMFLSEISLQSVAIIPREAPVG